MEGSPPDVTDPEVLQARTSELEDELRLRMAELRRLHDELAHLRADAVVKDRYIAVLSGEADKLQRVRDLVARMPLGSRLARSIESQLGERLDDGPVGTPAPSVRVRTTGATYARRARSLAGRIKRRLLVPPPPGT